MAESTSGRPLAVSVELVPAPEQQAAPPVAARGWIVDPLRALPGPAPSSVDVRIEGRRFEIPDDAHTAGSSWLRDFVEACYLFGDWPRLHAVSWQLHWMAPALADEFACADALMASPPSGEILRHAYGLNDAYKQFPYGTRTDFPGWAPMLVRYLRTSAAAQLHLTPSPDRRAAAIAHVQSLTNAFDAALAAFRARLRGELGRVEACAKARALQQLGDARTTILNQGWRLLGYKDGRTFEDWAERDTAYLISAQFNPPDDLDALLDAIDALAPLAEAVIEAEFQLHEEVFTRVARAVGRATGREAVVPSPAAMQLALLLLELYAAATSPKVAELRSRLVQAQVALAKGLAPAAARFPILLRSSPRTLDWLRRWPRYLGVETAERRLATFVYSTLRAALDANTDMRERLDVAQPVAAGGETVRLHDQGLAAECKDSVWAYPKVVAAALDVLYEPIGSTPRTAGERLVQDVARAKGDAESTWEAVKFFEGLVSLPLSVVCPPAGLALDVAFGLADAVLTTSAYLKQDAEYLCALDPVQAFAEVEPSVLPIVLSIGSVLLTGVTAIKLHG